MPRLSLWRQEKSNDYNFFDSNIREQFEVGGTAFLVHKYLGPENVGEQNDPSQPNHYASTNGASEVTIQDMLLMENRDRKYDPDIYELRGLYNVSDNDFDQIGREAITSYKRTQERIQKERLIRLAHIRSISKNYLNKLKREKAEQEKESMM